MTTFAMAVYFFAGPVLALAVVVAMVVDARREQRDR